MAFKAVAGPAEDKSAHRFLVVGPSGIGKTYLSSTIPGVFIVGVESGLKGKSPHHNPQTWSDPETGLPVLPKTIEELHEAIELAAQQPGIRHVVVDKLSGIEKLLYRKVCAIEKVAHMGAKDFKAVWSAATPLWDRLYDHLDNVRLKYGVHIWILADASDEYANVTETGDTYLRYDIHMMGSGRSLAEVRSKLRSWVDHVFFLNWATTVKKGKSMGAKTTVQYGTRVLHTREKPSYFAKTRFNMPDSIPATWQDLAGAMKNGKANSAESLAAAIKALLPELSEADAASVNTSMLTANTAAQLAQVLERARGLAATSDDRGEGDATASTADELDVPVMATRQPETASADNRTAKPHQPSEAAQAVAEAMGEAMTQDALTGVAIQINNNAGLSTADKAWLKPVFKREQKRINDDAEAAAQAAGEEDAA